jgi:predicted phosphodiesterase
MRIAILADIHGNVLALEAVLTDLESRKVDKFVNLGDCVSGPLWPRETAELLMRLSWPTVRGNHGRRTNIIGPTHSPTRHLRLLS